MQINLLSPQTIAKQQTGLEESTKKIAIVCGFITVAVLLGTGVVAFLNYSTKNNIADAKSEIKKLASVENKLNARNQLHQDLLTKKDNFNLLNNKKPLWTIHIDELKQKIPSTLSLQSIEFDTKTNEWTIKGQATTHDPVAQFGTALQGSPYFGKGLIKDSTKKETGGIEYTLTAEIAGGEQ